MTFSRLALSTLLSLMVAASASAQSAAVLLPAPVPACTVGDTVVYTSATTTECAAPSSLSQPLTDALALIRNATDGTKRLSFNLAGLTTATTRAITWPDADLTVPSTIASLGANTFTGTQTATAFSGVGTLLTALNATELTSGTVPLARLSGITNTEIAAAAGIAYSKLTLTGSLLDADVNAAAAIAWSKISKTGSSLADLATRSASDLTSGTLDSARLTGSYTGITGVGTVAAGTWQATAIGVAYGGTGLTSYAIGDLIYASGATTLAKLADVAAGSVLVSGGVGVAPVWSASPTVTSLTTSTHASIGTSVRVGTDPSSAGALRIPNASWLGARNAANTGDVLLISADSSNRTLLHDGYFIFGSDMQRFGGATSSFPAWKRNGTELALRLADDTAYTGLEMGYLKLSGATSTASSGAVRLSNTTYVTARRSDNLANINVIGTNVDVVEVGDASRVLNLNGIWTTVGGTGSAAPALKRFGNALAFRRGDDSAGGTVASLTACSAAGEGAHAVVTDSNTAVWGATIAGGGANRVLVYCNGTNWTVAAK